MSWHLGLCSVLSSFVPFFPFLPRKRLFLSIRNCTSSTVQSCRSDRYECLNNVSPVKCTGSTLLGRGVLRKQRGSAHIGMQKFCSGLSLGTSQLFDESPNMPWFFQPFFSLFCFMRAGGFWSELVSARHS